MTSLRWVADGIQVAERCGGVTLEKVRRFGFQHGTEVKQRPQMDQLVEGFPIEVDPDPPSEWREP